MPKEGWCIVDQDICPLCGYELRLPTEEDVSWTVDPVKVRFTGAMAVPICCNSVWATWRENDPVWRYEIKDHFYWKFKGGNDGKRNLDDRLEELRERVRGNIGEQRAPERNLLPGEGGRDMFLPEAIRAQMQSVVSEEDTEV